MSFAEAVREAGGRRGLRFPAPHDPEPLAALDYPQELVLKNDALLAFWTRERLPGRPEPIAAAPRPRGYRTTSKRRAVVRRAGRGRAAEAHLALVFPGAAGPERLTPSALDPPEHLAVYRFVLEQAERAAAVPLAAALNHVVVRGEPGALTLVLNVRVFEAALVRVAKQWAEALAKAPLGVRAAFLYLDPSDSDYYLEARRPAGVLSFKKLFGPDWLEVAVDGLRLRFPPTVFSQVNGPMIGAMTATAGSLLGPLAGSALLDLYCGYGLFSLTVGREAAQAVGVDHDGPAVEAARANARHLRSSARFLAGRLEEAFLDERLRRARLPECVLLDPPRQGTSPGVIAALARRGPERVVHVCCGTDEIPREVAAWVKAGFRLQRVLPLDLFPGSANLETFLLLGHA